MTHFTPKHGSSLNQVEQFTSLDEEGDDEEAVAIGATAT